MYFISEFLSKGGEVTEGGLLISPIFNPEDFNLALKHTHMFSNDGFDFGYFANSKVQRDVISIGNYTFEPIKYDADLIDEAKDIIDRTIEQKKQAVESSDIYTMQRGSYNVHAGEYNLLKYNCQHYMELLLSVANELAIKQGKKLILD